MKNLNLIAIHGESSSSADNMVTDEARDQGTQYCWAGNIPHTAFFDRYLAE